MACSGWTVAVRSGTHDYYLGTADGGNGDYRRRYHYHCNGGDLMGNDLAARAATKGSSPASV